MGSVVVNVLRIQYISIAVSIVLLLFIINMIRKKKIKEEYSLLWLLSGVVFLFFSVFRKALDSFAHLIGIDYAPAAIFLVLIGCIFMILVHFSVVISKLSERTKNLTQEIALMKIQMEQNMNGKKKK